MLRKFPSCLPLVLAVLLALTFTTASGLAQSCETRPFGTVTLNPAFEAAGEGLNVDTIAFWAAPDASNTLMFVTAKGNSLVEVWRYPFLGQAQPSLLHPTFADSPVNGVVVDQETDLLYVSVGSPASTVSVFSLPDLAFVMNFNKPDADFQGEPNLGLLKLPGGEKRLYVSADDIVFIHDAQSGALLGEFAPEKGLETIVGDDFHQALYIPDENGHTGIYAYQPDGTPFLRNGSNHFGDGGIFQKDAEGIIILRCPLAGGSDDGSGLILVSDQKKDITDFEVFDRRTWQHLGALRLNGVSNTDGIASFQQALPAHPRGVFAAIDDDNATAIIGWDEILAATEVITSVAAPAKLPTGFGLSPNFPNPFNPGTTIEYELPEPAPVKLVIYDLLGKPVRILQAGVQPAGSHRALWDGRDAMGLATGNGIYFYRLTAGDFTQTRKMVLVK